MFSPETYVQRRTHLIESMDSGILLLLGNEESGMNYADNVYHFRQDSSFLYFCGLDFPSLAAIIDLDDGTTTLFGDDLSIDMIVWTGPQPSLKERASGAGITKVKPRSKLASTLQAAKQMKRTIHFLPPYRPENEAKLYHMLGVPLGEAGEKASLELIRAIVGLRSIKSEEEIEQIEGAVGITNFMHLSAMGMANPDFKEADIAATVHQMALRMGGNLSFPIIASIHGEILHNHHHTNELESGRLLLVDTGAENAMHYAGDMTRTYPVDPRFTQKQKDVYNIVLAALDGAIDALKPGIEYREVHFLAAKIIAQGLKDLGLMKGNIETAVSKGAHALFFPHGLGHMMGLDVHDMEDFGEVHVGYAPGESKSPQFGLKSLRLARKLEPGFVLTVEPGIYFIPTLIDRWKEEGKFKDYLNYDAIEKYKDFGGIRIEDDYLITETGGQLLGEQVPKTVEAVEEVRNSGGGWTIHKD